MTLEMTPARQADHPPAGSTLDRDRRTDATLEVHVGDRLFVPGSGPGAPVREGLVLQVRHRDDSPPYRVRWSDTGHVSLVFPGPGAYVEHHECDPEAN